MIQVLRETYEAPPEVARTLAPLGLNRYGDPVYRAVWGGSRLSWIGGVWEDRDDSGNSIRENFALRFEPKYPILNRWHIEQWVAPERYGPPEVWYAQTIELQGGKKVDALGPYPSRGEYEHSFTVETPEGGFLQLTPQLAREIAKRIEFGRNQRQRTLTEAKSEFTSTTDRSYMQYADQVLST